ncbi:MAG TPA: GpE family phage tail protein [Sphingomonas sp.]|jgi:hypothetical protein
MADLAECWGWALPTMDNMELAELVAWRTRALARRPKER